MQRAGAVAVRFLAGSSCGAAHAFHTLFARTTRSPITKRRVPGWHRLCSVLSRRETVEQMRIAQVAPLYESVPPTLYGGTERIVSYLTEELVATRPRRDAFCQRRLDDTGATGCNARPGLCGSMTRCIDQLAHHIILLEHIARRSAEFDIIHFHIDYLHFPVSRLDRHAASHDAPRAAGHSGSRAALRTVLGRAGGVDLRQSAATAAHRQLGRHRLPRVACATRAPRPEGRAITSPSSVVSRPRRASSERSRLPAARGLPLQGRGQDRSRRPRLLRTRCRAALRGRAGRLLSARSARPTSRRFLSGARALLFPIDWEEPFGLVMIEAMACGTPVIAFRRGSVPEVLEDGVTGFFVESVDEAIAAVGPGRVAQPRALPRRIRAALHGTHDGATTTSTCIAR